MSLVFMSSRIGRTGLARVGTAPPISRAATVFSRLSGRQQQPQLTPVPAPARLAAVRRPFSTHAAFGRGIMPDTDDPSKQAEPTRVSRTVLKISDPEYHRLADQYLETLQSKFEEVQESREGVDVEYSGGVMSVLFMGKGTYVINKQPPNRQIWLSSPISGPSRYDWVVIGDTQEEKAGTGRAGWMDQRTGKSLDEMFLVELGLDLKMDTFD